MSIFIDTSIWYAATDASDRGNDRAKEILAAESVLLTTDHVLLETWMLLRSRMNRHVAEHFWEGLRNAGVLIESVGSGDLEAAWSIGQEFADQDFSIVDRTSFAVMQRLGIQRVASFDEHFAIYRYGRDRRRALDVIR